MGQPWKQTGVDKTNSFSPNIPKTAVLIKLFYELKQINYKTNYILLLLCVIKQLKTSWYSSLKQCQNGA